MTQFGEEWPPLSDQVHCTPLLKSSARIRSDGFCISSLLLFCPVRVRDADMERENAGIQNGRWLIRQVFYKYCKALRLFHLERARIKKSKLLCFTPSLSFSVVLFFDLPVFPVQSQGRGGDRMDGVSRGGRALEGQWAGDVTAVGRESTATGRLPCGAGHIGRRGAAVPHVG